MGTLSLDWSEPIQSARFLDTLSFMISKYQEKSWTSSIGVKITVFFQNTRVLTHGLLSKWSHRRQSLIIFRVSTKYATLMASRKFEGATCLTKMYASSERQNPYRRYPTIHCVKLGKNRLLIDESNRILVYAVTKFQTVCHVPLMQENHPFLCKNSIKIIHKLFSPDRKLEYKSWNIVIVVFPLLF